MHRRSSTLARRLLALHGAAGAGAAPGAAAAGAAAYARLLAPAAADSPGLRPTRPPPVSLRGFAAEPAPAAPPPPPRKARAGPAAPAAAPAPAPAVALKAEAQYVAAALDVYALAARPEFAGRWRKLHKGTAVLSLGEPAGAGVGAGAAEAPPPRAPFLVATAYGSVVFFGASRAERARWLAVVRGAATEALPPERAYTEEYALALVPDLPAWSQLEPDCVRLRALDLPALQVIAAVLAQSVALDFYAAHVERTLETFLALNQEMVAAGDVGGIDKPRLLRLVAENNTVMAEIVSKLGVHERHDVAWRDPAAGRVWEFLRAELELAPRFRTLDMKFNLVQDNLKYFLEILQARKSDSLEWTIIVLIGLEICLTVYELASKVG